jgi:CelD/BcsL family acetyltransferase involved in cellulose biosynthesis
MRIRELNAWPTDPDEAAQLRNQWNALLARSEASGIFQGYDWHAAWWECFGGGHELHLLLVYEQDGGLVGIAPLMVECRRRAGILQRRLMFVGTANHATDYADLIVARGHARPRHAVVEWIRAHDTCWTALELRNLPGHSPTLPLLAEARGLARPLVQFAAEAPSRRLGDAGADRAAINKRSLRRHLNGFQREGELRFERLQDPTAIDLHCGHFFEQHVGRWAGTRTPSLFNDPAQRRFYRVLAHRLGAAGTLHFSVVLFQEKPIAYHFGFESDGVLTWYKPSFAAELAKRSPGEVLLRCLLEDAVSRGLRELDFTVGSEAFKYRFANQVRHVYRVRAWRRGWERVPALLVEALKARVRHWRGAPPTPRITPSRSAGRAGSGTHPARST